MPLPKPRVALRDHCSVIHNHTLYTYQSDAFQSLSLAPGGQWSQLPMGVSTNGSVCVQGSPNGQDSLWIVGGITNSSVVGFSGLQRYNFQDRRWETINPGDTVTQNRQGHGAVYLKDSSTVLIYGGSQEGTAGLSAQSFSISMLPPYAVIAHSTIAPPLLKPLMMPWNASHALMLGGDPANRNGFTFGPDQGWRILDTQLDEGLPDSSKAQTVLMDSGDGSRVLEIFDMSIPPNQLSTRVLQGPTGQNASTSASASVLPSSTPTRQASRKRKRETESDTRPAYDSTRAPQTVRNGFSLTRDQNGLVVVSGGVSPNSPELLSFSTRREINGSIRKSFSPSSMTQILPRPWYPRRPVLRPCPPPPYRRVLVASVNQDGAPSLLWGPPSGRYSV